MSKGIRKTIEQQIAEATAKLKELRAKQKAKIQSKSELTAESDGMKHLLEMVATVSKNNKVSVSDVVRAIAKLKKTKLKIESLKRKSKATLTESKEI